MHIYDYKIENLKIVNIIKDCGKVENNSEI